MRTQLYRPKCLATVLSALVVALAATGCGGSSSTTAASHPPASHPAAAPATSTASPPAAVRKLRILSPRSGVRTGQTVTVRLALTGAKPTGSGSFRYILDGRASRGSPRRTFHGLGAGRHHLLVMLAADHSVQASRTFVVRAPAPAPSPAPVAAPAATSPPAPVAPAPAPSPSPAPAPGPTPAPAPAPAPSPPPPSHAGGIPQGNGGDMDADNNGGPSDGDGNI